MNRPIAFIIVSAVLITACNKRASSDATPLASASAMAAVAPVPQPRVLPVPTASASPEPARALGLFADKLPAGLGPLDVTPLDVATMTKSTDLDTDAAKSRTAKDYAKAKELYLAALKTDPGNHAARYNLARTLILDGQVEPGLAVLDQLSRVESCYVCEGLLLRAAREKDFAAAAARPEFKERTTNVGKQLPTFTRAAEMMVKWLDKPTLDDLPPLVDSRTFIVLKDAAGFHKFKGGKAFVEYVVDQEKEHFPKGRKWGPKLGPPLGMSLECKNECCDVDTYDPPKGRSVLRQLCFTPQGNSATALYKVLVD